MSKTIGLLFALLTLSACTSEFIIVEGRPGTSGTNGVNGQDGVNGLNSLIATAPSTSCATGGISVLSGLDSDRNNVLDIAEVTASAEVCNGTAGINGQNGADGQNAPPTPFTPTELVDPCGDTPGKTDEVLLRLANGQLLVSFSDNAAGLNTRFAVLSPGTYMTTDGTLCLFTVQNDGTVVW